jgi:hypothetical protein
VSNNHKFFDFSEVTGFESAVMHRKEGENPPSGSPLKNRKIRMRGVIYEKNL